MMTFFLVQTQIFNISIDPTLFQIFIDIQTMPKNIENIHFDFFIIPTFEMY